MKPFWFVVLALLSSVSFAGYLYHVLHDVALVAYLTMLASACYLIASLCILPRRRGYSGKLVPEEAALIAVWGSSIVMMVVGLWARI